MEAYTWAFSFILSLQGSTISNPNFLLQGAFSPFYLRGKKHMVSCMCFLHGVKFMVWCLLMVGDVWWTLNFDAYLRTVYLYGFVWKQDMYSYNTLINHMCSFKFYIFVWFSDKPEHQIVDYTIHAGVSPSHPLDMSRVYLHGRWLGTQFPFGHDPQKPKYTFKYTWNRNPLWRFRLLKLRLPNIKISWTSTLNPQVKYSYWSIPID